ncbi:scavenger receptor class B member 1-like isoform X2 [Copidosoma floridanum]|uniref:scavenger receptor class B member 1-like isoform X2 n=1 Tax=Copidosoma floridanum TaxID=29053 RepID=UPI0006C98062|nr:scavenger receptor class B member 1-like isoform X2 [Copidosoma floridanum]
MILKLRKVNPEIGLDGTITYQEMRSYHWESGHSDHEVITVPNIPLFTAMAFSRDMSFLTQVSLTAILSTIQAKAFIKVSAGDFLWGYDDELFRIAKPVIEWQQNIPYEKFGMLAFKTGLSNDRITINSGVHNLRNIGNIIRVNGKSTRNIWHNKSCDKIEGSDGSIFPPKILQNYGDVIKVYAKEMCRPISLEYSHTNHSKGIPVLRYTLSENVFISNSTYNSCFCQKHVNANEQAAPTCSPEGIFNNSLCHYGAPMLSSFPHFFKANEKLLTHIKGLKPKKEQHSTYIDLHPRLGVPIGGWSRIQLNLEVRKADAVPFIGHIKDGTVLPILWIEVGINKIPKSAMNILYHAYYTLNAVETCLQIGSLTGLLIITVSLFIILYKH